ncbi:hypothetical protein HYFRA_00005468 [Hymenoscyphus fraxineus]|uniref:Uncharacterized protein n=1 Tax=Hymenoscyphus fraxineus TaxID=746836 RepID=A0A9N9PQP2_9HELO|nr:hypothetical protein HYFRA_00005468 [Hymenoscyphus fraxineus]
MACGTGQSPWKLDVKEMLDASSPESGAMIHHAKSCPAAPDVQGSYTYRLNNVRVPGASKQRMPAHSRSSWEHFSSHTLSAVLLHSHLVILLLKGSDDEKENAETSL